MMTQTATVQVNIDYGSEADAMQKLRVGMGISPLFTAMFANSPLSDGDLNGYASFRGHIWSDTDNARSGLVCSRIHETDWYAPKTVGGNEWRRRQFAPLLIEVEHVAPTYTYRDRRDDESEAEYAARLVAELEATIARVGGENVIAFVAETVGGATSGCLTPPAGYFKGVRELCDRHGILLILDEVMCGMGRTGTLHACEQEGVAPDLMAIAKGLGGGYQPVGAVLIGGRVIDAIAGGSGFFQHGHTYIGHPVACAAALAVQKVLARDRLVERCAALGERLRGKLEEAFGQHPHVGDIRGRGLFQAIELVADRSTREPFDPALKLHARIKRAAFDLGLACYPMGGTIDGARGDHVLLAPPFILSDDELGLLLERLVRAVDHAIASVR